MSNTLLSLLCFLLCTASGNLVLALSDTCSSATLTRYNTLYGYGPVQVYCAREHPEAASAPTITTCNPSSRAQARRRARSGGWHGGAPHNGLEGGSGSWHHIPFGPGPGPPSSSPGPSSDPQESLFAALLHQNEETISTFCSCLANPDFHVQTITCPNGQSCNDSGTCQVERDCHNPARCDASSFCGKGHTGDPLFCHQDADDAATGYCMNDGPPDASCPAPDQYEDCTSNAECGGQRLCIYSCCREEPFCINVADYKDPGSTPSNGTAGSAGET